MAKRSKGSKPARVHRHKTRAGFSPVQSSYKSGHFDYYKDLRTGEKISRRQYQKRTENIPSLEKKAKRLARERAERGIETPLRRHSAIVEQYKLIHPGARVRGKGSETFKKMLADYKNQKRDHRTTVKRLRAALHLGVMNTQQAKELFGSFPELREDVEMIDDMNDERDGERDDYE